MIQIVESQQKGENIMDNPQRSWQFPKTTKMNPPTRPPTRPQPSVNTRSAYDRAHRFATLLIRQVTARVRTVDKTKDHSWWLRWFKPTYDAGGGRVRSLALFLGYGGAAMILFGGGLRTFILGLIMAGCGVLWRSVDL